MDPALLAQLLNGDTDGIDAQAILRSLNLAVNQTEDVQASIDGTADIDKPDGSIAMDVNSAALLIAQQVSLPRSSSSPIACHVYRTVYANCRDGREQRRFGSR